MLVEISDPVVNVLSVGRPTMAATERGARSL
jgi:hypothetical protein